MASQALLIENTIRDMKKAMVRNDDGSDSDSSFARLTNRGNKLKRKAKFVREGRLAQADGPQVYKRQLMYNGYPRHVISRNPPRVDQDGDVVDSENENSDLDTTDAEDDPYRDVHLENILMPLTAAADLDKHLALSVPYTNHVLENMVQTLEDTARREQATFWGLKNMHIRFRGDDSFAPCVSFQAEEKIEDFDERQEAMSAPISVTNDTDKSDVPVTNWHSIPNIGLMTGLENMGGPENPKRNQVSNNSKGAARMAESRLNKHNSNGTVSANRDEAAPAGPSELQYGEDQDEQQNHIQESRTDQQEPEGDTSMLDLQNDVVRERATIEAEQTSTEIAEGPRTTSTVEKLPKREEAIDDSSFVPSLDQSQAQPEQTPDPERPYSCANANPLENGIATQDHAPSPPGASEDGNITHRMTTRSNARAQASTNGHPTPLSTTSVLSSTPLIHPFFLAPLISLPDPQGGLHPHLADEVRRYLSLYVQKQSEVVRQTDGLLQGLRRAQRMKQTVWDWCRGEGHVGEMSDGEDWIDMEKWGLEVPLRKGEEVEDEDTGVGAQGKPRRHRRVAG